MPMSSSRPHSRHGDLFMSSASGLVREGCIPTGGYPNRHPPWGWTPSGSSSRPFDFLGLTIGLSGVRESSVIPLGPSGVGHGPTGSFTTHS
jgi:hypothetical protein